MSDSRFCFKFILKPITKLYSYFRAKRNYYVGAHNPQKRIDELHKIICGKSINWKDPQDINDKINWLKINTDTSLWSVLADKYAVRKFVAERGLSSILVPLYGHWYNADDIDFDSLPNSFVLKDTHGSGTNIVVRNKASLNIKAIKRKLNKWLKTAYGVAEGEVHYKDINPSIIAEQLLVDSNCLFSNTLVDYKVWSFDGKPYSIWACYNRTSDYAYVSLYDTEWNYHPECSHFTNHYRDGKNVIPKPATLHQMLEAASILSKGFPEVRVDFYEVNNKLYFGEMTFTSAGGHMDFYTQDYLNELGKQVRMPYEK